MPNVFYYKSMDSHYIVNGFPDDNNNNNNNNNNIIIIIASFQKKM